MDKKTELAISLGQTIYNNTIDSLTKQRDDALEKLRQLESHDELNGFAITIEGHIAAWFARPDEAQEWARDNYFGQWLMTSYSIPAKPLFTEDQIKKAEVKAKELSEFFNPTK